MRKSELERALNRLRSARDASNWQGKFTADIRQATVTHRMEEIAKPLDEVISLVERALDKRTRKRHHRKTETAQYRAPYKDD